MKKLITIISIYIIFCGNTVAQDSWWEKADKSNSYNLNNFKIIVIVGDDFDWHETFIIPERWKEWGAQITYAGNKSKIIGHIKKKVGNTFSNSDTASISIDIMLSRVSTGDYDIIYLPGGYGPKHLIEDKQSLIEVKRIITSANDEGKLIAAICHGPLLLAASEIIKGKTVTGHGSIEKAVVEADGIYVKQKVVVDRNVITGNWPYFESFAATVAKVSKSN